MRSGSGRALAPGCALLIMVLLAACGGGGDGGGDPVAGTDDDGGGSSGTTDPGSTTAACDFETVNGAAVLEAESLPLDEHDDWLNSDDRQGFVGSGYWEWVGGDHFNDPTHGVMSVAIRINEPGRYRLWWHTRIGKGSNATEHNDSWVKFADADDYYGLRKVENGEEFRRYPRPKCSDATLMDSIEARDEVAEAVCVDGSSRDGWLKVYATGATDWKWSGFTSDNDASRVLAEFEEAGVYELRFAARSAHHLVDRIVLHEESLPSAVVEDLTAPETVCPG